MSASAGAEALALAWRTTSPSPQRLRPAPPAHLWISNKGPLCGGGTAPRFPELPGNNWRCGKMDWDALAQVLLAWNGCRRNGETQTGRWVAGKVARVLRGRFSMCLRRKGRSQRWQQTCTAVFTLEGGDPSLCNTLPISHSTSVLCFQSGWEQTAAGGSSAL